jgi:hypothetical protein
VRILLYNPDNGVTRNFMPHLWMFLLQALTPAGHEVLLIDGNAQPVDEDGIARFVLEQHIGLVGIGAMTRMIAKAYLSFAKTPQGLESGPRNNVTKHSVSYSFQTHLANDRRLNHSDGEAERFYRELKQRGVSVRGGDGGHRIFTLVRAVTGRVRFRCVDWGCGRDQEETSPQAEDRPPGCPAFAEVTAGKSLSSNLGTQSRES